MDRWPQEERILRHVLNLLDERVEELVYMSIATPAAELPRVMGRLEEAIRLRDEVKAELEALLRKKEKERYNRG